MTRDSTLEPTPSAPLARSDIPFGTYAGRASDTRLSRSDISLLRKTLSEKRWQWATAFDDHLAVGGAIVDAGFFGTAFLWVFDREREELLVDADVVVPSALLSVTTAPTTGKIARISLPRRSLSMLYEGEQLAVSGRFATTTVELAFTPDDERAITAVCPVPERHNGVNVTQKEAGVPVSGQVSVGSREFEMDGVGFLDYSHGLLGRDTRWDWGFAHGGDGSRSLGFNLVDKFNDGVENVVWVDGVPQSVGNATLERVEESAERWHISTDCGTVDATLTVEGRRQEDINIGLIRSYYDQPLGSWQGTVAGYEFSGVGVAEEHHTRW